MKAQYEQYGGNSREKRRLFPSGHLHGVLDNRVSLMLRRVRCIYLSPLETKSVAQTVREVRPSYPHNTGLNKTYDSGSQGAPKRVVLPSLKTHKRKGSVALKDTSPLLPWQGFAGVQDSDRGGNVFL